jgi:hypothetical protein
MRTGVGLLWLLAAYVAFVYAVLRLGVGSAQPTRGWGFIAD